MNEPHLLVFSLNATQAVIAFVLALVFLAFFRIYRRAHLRYWAWSFLAGTIYYLFSGLALVTAAEFGATVSIRTVFSALSLSAAYPQVVWLLAGAYVAATQRRLVRRRLNAMLLGSATLGLVSALLYSTDPTAAEVRMFLRVELRTLLIASSFIFAGALLWRSQARQQVFGQRLLASAFLFFGMQQLALLGGMLSQRSLGWTIEWLPVLGLVELVAQLFIGLALAAWLLEEERNRARNATRRLYHLSFHDALTGLPNRKLFLERVAHALAQEQSETRYIVAVVNVDRFRLLNESMGHQQADRLLALVGDRLLHRAPRVDTVARIGSDEFALLFREELGGNRAMAACRQLLTRLRETFHLDDRAISLTCSIGVACFPDDANQPEALLANASAATIRAKEHGGDQIVTFAADMSGRAQEQLDLENDLRRGIEKREFTLVYQPVLLARGGQVIGFEALLRWKHPKRGLLNPDDFLPLAERLGLMDRITEWVLDNACRQIRDWRQKYDMTLWVAVNFSASAFRSSQLLEQVTRALRTTKLAPEDLVIEITENVAMENFESGVVTLEQLRMAGIRIAIDDFGTGYSSLSYLRRLPIDKIKLDKEFVREISRDIGSMAIVDALVPLAHKLGIKVVAEGVETDDQLAQLRRAGVDEIQGYLMYEPMPPATCESMLESSSAARYFSNEVI